MYETLKVNNVHHPQALFACNSERQLYSSPSSYLLLLMDGSKNCNIFVVIVNINWLIYLMNWYNIWPRAFLYIDMRNTGKIYAFGNKFVIKYTWFCCITQGRHQPFVNGPFKTLFYNFNLYYFPYIYTYIITKWYFSIMWHHTCSISTC